MQVDLGVDIDTHFEKLSHRCDRTLGDAPDEARKMLLVSFL
jgi:hypothetical protein